MLSFSQTLKELHIFKKPSRVFSVLAAHICVQERYVLRLLEGKGTSFAQKHFEEIMKTMMMKITLLSKDETSYGT